MGLSDPLAHLTSEDVGTREIVLGLLIVLGASLVAQLVKNPPAMQETWI